MTDVRIHGYCDPLAARAGEPVDFMVSAEGTNRVNAQIVRLIHGDENPLGPGFVEEEVASDVPAEIEATRQYTQIGSFAEVSDPQGKLQAPGAFSRSHDHRDRTGQTDRNAGAHRDRVPPPTSASRPGSGGRQLSIPTPLF